MNRNTGGMSNGNNGRRLGSDPQASRENSLRRMEEKYKADSKVYEKKLAEKENKKRMERLERYSHIDTGSVLSDQPTQPRALSAVRDLQQQRYQEANQLKQNNAADEELKKKEREDKKRAEFLEKYKHVDTGCVLARNSDSTADSVRIARMKQQQNYEKMAGNKNGNQSNKME